MFEWFCETYSGGTASWAELKAWADMTGEQPTTRELRLMRKIALKFNEVT